jgi:putative redox protein
MGVEINVDYRGNLQCTATHGPSKQVLTTDAPVDNGGKGSAFSPTDLVATALGGCMLTIMGIVAQRNGLDISGSKAHVIKEMASTPIRRIGKLIVVITLPASLKLNASDRAKLENAAMTCPVKQSLHPDVQLDIQFQHAS